MSKRTGMWLAAAGFLIASLVIGFLSINGGTRVEYTITTQEAQQMLNTSLEKRAVTEKSVNVESATVRFADDKLFVDATLHGMLGKRTVRAQITAVGKPDYRGGAFFFKPTEPVRFSEISVKKEQTGNSPFANTLEKLKHKTEELAVRHGWEDVTEALKADIRIWSQKVAENGVTTALTKRPIYTPKNDLKGMAVRAAVEKVQVVGDTLVVTISLTQILYSIFIALVILVIAIGVIIALVRNPELGIALALLPHD